MLMIHQSLCCHVNALLHPLLVQLVLFHVSAEQPSTCFVVDILISHGEVNTCHKVTQLVLTVTLEVLQESKARVKDTAFHHGEDSQGKGSITTASNSIQVPDTASQYRIILPRLMELFSSQAQKFINSVIKSCMDIAFKVAKGISHQANVRMLKIRFNSTRPILIPNNSFVFREQLKCSSNTMTFSRSKVGKY